ncbi:UvrB/UvrC motif-containing protein [Clostridium mediterraneense]|uniref:UvrB/UvrC motif-containing protein n=1 Tax=Clostridium mediterraneense TaxID=1805472 RepID=UPI0008359714|nr:UvrB/UvrC motif-containing protein [Clostridium mediterraneense]
MICEKCNKNEASVHLVRIANGKKEHLMLCEKCAIEMGDLIIESEVKEGDDFDINKILNGLVDYMSEKEQDDILPSVINCDRCKTNFRDVKSSGRVGCSECYKSFEKTITDMIIKAQGSAEHIGRIALKMRGEIDENSYEIKCLEEDLKDAIEFENYEVAAVIRDKIKKFKKLKNKDEEDE